MIFLKKIFPFLFLIILVGVFFYKTIFFQLTPFPGDMIVGAYYPWLDYQWSNLQTNVPIKNPLISDVFSQFFLWKKTIIDSLKNFQFPLWNIYSYSGYPLLANFHSGVFNPFNLFLLIPGYITGWNLMIISQFIFSSICMFLFLKELYDDNFSALTGAIVYSFSGFLITWSQFVTAGFAMIWLPLIFLSIERFFKYKKIKYLLYLSILYFLLMSSGHYQALIYGCFFSGLYFLYKLFFTPFQNKVKTVSWYLLSVVLGILLMFIQLLPTFEISKYSVRFNENYISEYNFGLLSLDRVITLFAPDYFGNPTTFNFWGTFNYHETVIYCGILSLFSIIFSVYKFKKLKQEKFFLFFAVLSLLLAFNTFFGKLIYLIKIPGISTSAAGRIIFIFTFSISILSAFFIKNIKSFNFKNSLRFFWGYFLFLGIITFITFICYKNTSQFPLISSNFKIGLRNLILPILISSMIFFVIAFIKNEIIKKILLIFIIIFDLFRFGWKYLPFTPREYFYPTTDIIDFLKRDDSIFRIEKEKGPLITPNIWSFYSLQSTSGYDPMALNDYSMFFQKELNKNQQGGSSRYSEIENYDAASLGEANVKYLLALNYDNTDKISSSANKLNYKINTSEWQEVFRYKSISVLKNTKFKDRLEVINDPKAIISNIFYSSNKILLDIDTNKPNSSLILRDTWYPGWQATINNKKVNIDKYQNIYRQINLNQGKNHVEFYYQPKTFTIGLYISLIGAITWIVFYIKNKNKTL